MNILTSESGKRMITYIAPIYEQSAVMQTIFECTGKEVDDLQAWCEDIKMQLFPQTATWGLSIWEQRLGIVTSANTPIEARRQAIMSKLTIRTPMTPARMKYIVESITGVSAIIEENVAPYTFWIYLLSLGNRNIDIDRLIEAVKNAKPAHLSFGYTIEARTGIKIGIGIEYFKFVYRMVGTASAGTIPDISTIGIAEDATFQIDAESNAYKFNYSMVGTKPDESTEGSVSNGILNADAEMQSFKFTYVPCGTKKCGH
jgi:hypothetical protein